MRNIISKIINALNIDTFKEDIIAVIVDEVHMAQAAKLKDLLTGPFANSPIRWGLTGTLPS